MYIAHWGLSRAPFSGPPNPADYYASATHEECLARMMYLVENGRRLGFLLGESGTGKSLLLAVAARHLHEAGCHVVRMNLNGLDAPQLAFRLSTALGHLSTPHADPVDWWRGITDGLAANRHHQVTTVILLDDAGPNQADIDGTISRLALTDQQPETRLTIVLARSRQAASRCAPKLKELCELSVEMEPWDATDTAGYVRETLVRLGGSDHIFAPEALLRLHELSGGIPRQVRQLAETCLVAGAADRFPQIGPQLVVLVHHRLADAEPVPGGPPSDNGTHCPRHLSMKGEY